MAQGEPLKNLKNWRDGTASPSKPKTEVLLALIGKMAKRKTA